ncbi:membrane progestin receptor beta-like isoform X1 [Mizuhopecten yessoensis]|uniref:membrane progestin receptor beta-like isoform X1 n=1 Tax=Mizuhopecten yessoensis TaxID=6573 RepID=UPI000B45D250|nr:membrane progestin receptor beta-like isoform X1 [Mizuhopecten yessoensis]
MLTLHWIQGGMRHRKGYLDGGLLLWKQSDSDSMLVSLVPTTSRKSVPEVFHLSHVETGFRTPHQPWSYYVYSFFQKHNECLNCWTHLLGMCMALNRATEFAQNHSLLGDPHMWPLTAGLITMVLMYLCSTIAHCFSNRSELVHYTAFMIDYAGIGLFGVGSVILHHHYCHDDAWVNSWLQTNAVVVSVVMGMLVCLCCSASSFLYEPPYPFARTLLQISAVVTIYLWNSVPIVLRLFQYLGAGLWHSSLDHHIQQMIWFAVAGFFFSSDIPQRFFPGKFDFLGHSHQIFHLCIIMVTEKQLDGITHELERLGTKFATMALPTFWNSIGAVILAIIFNGIVVVFCHIYVRDMLAKEKKKD